ncbi:MAG TPA: CoA transferase, partial [Dehalococcoidia bacterium]|nr:CoA transferase [Dehalococcoidia bacterium]
TGASRTEHYDELAPILIKVLKTKTTNEWIRELAEVGIPCGPINNIAEVAADPQVEHRNMIVNVPHPKLGKVKMINTPVKLSRTPGSIEGPAPELGQDTREILAELLTLSDDEINELKESGII